MAEGYGSDVWCTDKMQPGRFTHGVRTVLQSYERRLTTPRGMLMGLDDEDVEASCGLDVSGYCGAVGVSAAAIANMVAGELRKDDRTQSISAVGTETDLGAGMRAIRVECEAVLVGESESFRFTVNISDADGVEIVAGLSNG